VSQETDVGANPGAMKWGVGGWALVVAAFAIGFINFPLRVVGWQFDHLPGDGIDNRLNNFVLEHGYRYVTGRANSFWDAPAFYPSQRITACSDAHLGMLPIYSAFRLAGFSPEDAFQGWFLLPFALNFVAAAWALRRLGAGYAGVAAGAYVFAFAIPLTSQLTHAQLYPRFLVPPAVVFGWEFLRLPRTSRLAACLACVVYQVYVSVYIGYFLAILLASGFVISVARYGSQLPWNELLRPGQQVWLARTTVLVAAGLALLPLASAHGRVISTEITDFVRAIAPSPKSWVTPSRFAAVVPLLTEPHSQSEGEQQLFPGFTAILAVGIGLIAAIWARPFGGRTSQLAVAAWSVFAIGLCVTPFDLVWLYRPLLELPGGSSIRAIGRIVLVLLFPIAIAIAAGVDVVVCWARRFGRTAAAVAGALAVAFVAADQLLSPTDGTRALTWENGRLSRDLVVARQNQIRDAINRHPDPTLVYVFPSVGEGPDGWVTVQIDAMRAAQDLGIPCVNGYSGYRPPAWDAFPDYRSLMVWLQSHQTPQSRLAGLVLVGEPAH
jgi:hypothetical protein